MIIKTLPLIFIWFETMFKVGKLEYFYQNLLYLKRKITCLHQEP